MKRFLLSLLIALTLCGLAAGGVGATSDTVSVMLPDLMEGDTVGGTVSVRVIAAAPEPITSVEYFVDDALLAKVVLAPFSYEWDSTQFAPGAHRLTARATDRAGHAGETSVRLNVVTPLQVMFSAPSDAIPIGQVINLNAQIMAVNAISQVDLVVDNQVLSSEKNPTRETVLTLDTSRLQPGVHQVTIRVQDVQGHQTRASLPLKFETVADYTWVSVLLIIGLIAAVIAAGFAVWRTIQVVRRSYWRTCQLELCNEGNVPARYEIMATDPAGALKFKLLLNGVALTPEPPAKPAARSNQPAPSASSSQPKKSTAASAREKSGILINIAYTISTIIPNTSIGQKLAQWALTAQNVDYSAQRVEHAGQQAQSLGGKPAATPAPYDSPYAAPPEATIPAPPPPPLPVPELNVTPGAWCTPYLQPGDMLSLNLSIDPGRPVQTQHYTFQISSRAVDPEQDAAVVETGQLQVDSVPLIKYYLPFFIIAGVIVVATLIIVILLSNAGALG